MEPGREEQPIVVAAGLVGWASPAGRMWLVAAALGAGLSGLRNSGRATRRTVASSRT